MAIQNSEKAKRVVPTNQTSRRGGISLATGTPEPVPVALWEELNLMRRDPRRFKVAGKTTCKVTGGGCEKGDLVVLSEGEYVGRWCPDHGWHEFNSVRFPPTERLTKYEIADRDRVKKPRAKAAGA